jgi:hypothetical protein
MDTVMLSEASRASSRDSSARKARLSMTDTGNFLKIVTGQNFEITRVRWSAGIGESN